jgi:hypothetical protein
MRAKGVTYDTGFIHRGVSTRDWFEPDLVGRELRIIRDDLHCAAVRLTGADPDRLELAARLAVDLGLETWLAPFTSDIPQPTLLDLLADCATRAERLRAVGAEVVFVTGAELSLFTPGFLPGQTLEDRLGLLKRPSDVRAAISDVPARLNVFLADAAATVRQRFGGKVTYAAIPTFEGVDWRPFDFVSVDLYRTKEIAGRFREGVSSLVAQGKPVAITEFGCATHRGAADKGAWGGAIVEYEDARAVRLDDDYVRDESEQAACIRELLEIVDAEGVDTAFLCTFASYHLLHRANPRDDLDMASYGIVKVLESAQGKTYPNVPWEPKSAFHTFASYSPHQP